MLWSNTHLPSVASDFPSFSLISKALSSLSPLSGVPHGVKHCHLSIRDTHFCITEALAQHYYPLGGGSIFETTSLSFSMALVGTKEQLCCLSAAPLDVFWGKAHPFSVLPGCTVGQKPTQPKWHCIWWLNCGSSGCKGGGGTRYPAGRLPGSTEHLCTSASMPTPGILTKLLTSSGGPRGEPGANVHDLVLN